MKLKHDVTGDGPVGGALVIGGIPSEYDIDQPFSGPSGKILRYYCAEVGLDKVRFENVVEAKQGKNNEHDLYRDKNHTLPTPELMDWRKDLRERIALIKPKVIVACGDTPLKALTSYTSIPDVHCYVLRDQSNAICPIIPAYSPAFIMRQKSNSYWLKFALAKAKEVMEGKEDPPYNINIKNTLADFTHYIKKAQETGEVCIDIETIKNKLHMTAVGVSYNKDSAVSISRSDMTSADWNACIELLRNIMADPQILKIGQNFMFDSMMLWKMYSMKVQGPVWDTMHAANTIYSDLRKSLAELIRLYLYRAPHKGGWNTTGEQLRIYNAQDIITTHRIMYHQREVMQKNGTLDYFTATPQKMFVPAFDMAVKGIRVDNAQKESMAIDIKKILAPIAAEMGTWANQYLSMGEKKKKKRDNTKDVLANIKDLDLSKLPEKYKAADVHEILLKFMIKAEVKEYYVAKKSDRKHGLCCGALYKKSYRPEISLYKRDFNPKSPKQVDNILRNAGVKLPKVKCSVSKKWKESTNDTALKKILERNTDSAEVIHFIKQLLILRGGYKMYSSYCEATLDADNRWRCHYNIEGTETGRSSSKKTAWGTGGNNQNIPRDGFRGLKFKNVFKADEGYTLFQSDQEQAEARVVAYLAKCKKLIELLDNKEDIHVYAINSILGEDIRTFSPEKYKLHRQYGKIVNHGGNYDMGPMTLADSALKMGIDLDPSKAQYFLDKRKEVFPEIYENWHTGIQEQLHKDRTLWTPFGRRRIFMGKIDSKIYREAYAHIPQSTVPHLTNLMWLWVARQNDPNVDVLQMGHDSLLMQVRDDKLSLFQHSFLASANSLKFKLNNYDIIIPWDSSTGKNWGELS